MYPPQQQDQNPNSTVPTQEPTDQQIDSSTKPQNLLADVNLEDTNFIVPDAVKQPSFNHQLTMADIAPAQLAK